MMLSSQMYSKLFRPWDVAEEVKSGRFDDAFYCTEKPASLEQRKEIATVIKEPISFEHRHKRNNLHSKQRKIRRQIKSEAIDFVGAANQDSTISTTTDEPHATEKTKFNSIEYVEEVKQNKIVQEMNERLGQPYRNNTSESTPRKSSSNKSKSNKKEEAAPALPIQQSFGQYHPEIINSLELLQYQDPYSPHLGRHPSDLLAQAELAQSLGIAPSDPLLIESFAQGYAMELEYARIMHQENQTKLLNARKQRPKKYRCPHCDVGFSNNGQLKGHIRIHTGERPFKCDDKSCGKTFTRNEELTRHRRIHSGLRPYPCQTCGKKFGRRDHLKKHTKTHMVQAERMMPMFVPLSAIPQVAGYPYIYGY